MTSIYIAALFGLVAVCFIILSITTIGSPPARKTWRLIGFIFAAVSGIVIALHPR